MGNLRRSWIFGVMVLFAMAAAASIIGLSQPRFYGSPTAVRVPGKPWLGAQLPPTERPTPDLLTLADVDLQIQSRKITIARNRQVRDSPDGLAVETVEAKRGEAAVFSDGSSIRPIAGSLGYAIGGDERRYLLETTEFDPATGSTTAGLVKSRPEIAKLLPFWPTREISFGTGALTNIGLIYELKGLPDASQRTDELWDGQTGFFCDRCRGGFAVRDRVFYDSFYGCLLHPFEAIATVNLLHGPLKDFRLEPRAGEEAVGESFRFAILEVVSGQATYAGLEDLHGREIQILGKNFQKASDHTLFIVSWSSDELPQLADFDAIDTKGSPHPAIRLKVDTRLKGLAFFVAGLARQDIVNFRIRVRTHAKRAVFHLGKLPGMPEANQHLSNLFDVTVPWIAAGSINDWEDLVQLEFNDPSLFAGFSPSEYRDVRFGEIFREAIATDPAGRYVINQGTHQIVRLPPRWQWLRDRTPDWFPLPK